MPAGRPRKPVDLEVLSKLAERQWTTKELAAFFGVSIETMDRRFADHINQARARGTAKLRDLQWDIAVNKKDTKMVIWLGKQYLGQKERHEVDNHIVESTTPDAAGSLKKLEAQIEQMRAFQAPVTVIIKE